MANITDINDKIYAAARAAGVASEALAAEMTEHYKADTERLGLGRPDHEPLASEYVEPIVALIADLIERGHAYAVDGDVYFRVRSLPEYGELSHRAIDEMDQGEGVEGAARKEDALDFALWKGEKEDEDAAWPSPWGLGRPGWHIECSAMAEQLLGVELDIHGGGSDLLFPHHENEAAQTLAARGRPLARLWMHNGMLQLGDEKMAKSDGQHPRAGRGPRRGRARHAAHVLRRRPLPAADRLLARAPRRRRGERRARPGGGAAARRRRLPGGPGAAARRLLRRAGRRLQHGAGAGEPVRLDPRGQPPRGRRSATPTCARCSAVLGLDNLLDASAGPPPELLELAERRAQARAARDFAEADRLRDELRAEGWEVRDGADGPELVPVA